MLNRVHPNKTAAAIGDYVVSLQDAAITLGVHPDTLKNRARKGELEIIRISTRRLGIRASEMKRILAGLGNARFALK